MELPYFCTISTAGALFLLIIWTWRRSEDLVTRRLEVLFFFSVFVGLVEAATWLYSPSQIPRPLLAKPSVESDQSERDVFSKKLAGDQNASEPSLSGPALTYALSQDGLSGLDRWTAIYDISAHAVYLPNGEALEAHSGLALQLHFDMSALCFCLMCSSPERPGDDELWSDAFARKARRDTADFLHRPTDQRSFDFTAGFVAAL